MSVQNFGPIGLPNVVTRGHCSKHMVISRLTVILIARITNFMVGASKEATSQVIKVFDLTCFQGPRDRSSKFLCNHRKFQGLQLQRQNLVSLLFDLESCNLVLWCRHPLCLCQISARSHSKYGHQGALFQTHGHFQANSDS